jgi:hypothetical protein
VARQLAAWQASLIVCRRGKAPCPCRPLGLTLGPHATRLLNLRRRRAHRVLSSPTRTRQHLRRCQGTDGRSERCDVGVQCALVPSPCGRRVPSPGCWLERCHRDFAAAAVGKRQARCVARPGRAHPLIRPSVHRSIGPSVHRSIGRHHIVAPFRGTNESSASRRISNSVPVGQLQTGGRPSGTAPRHLTGRAGGSPTAGRQARAGGTRYILVRQGMPTFRRGLLRSNLGHLRCHPESCTFDTWRQRFYLQRTQTCSPSMFRWMNKRSPRSPRSEFNKSYPTIRWLERHSLPSRESGVTACPQGK